MKTQILRYGFFIPVIMLLLAFTVRQAGNPSNDMTHKTERTDDSELVVLWTSGDREVALKMVFMYAHNAKKNGWWDDVTFIIWGPSAKLTSEDAEIAERVKAMGESGIKLEACKACADMYQVSDDLAALGVDVKWMGVPLTDYIKQSRVITF